MARGLVLRLEDDPSEVLPDQRGRQSSGRMSRVRFDLDIEIPAAGSATGSRDLPVDTGEQLLAIIPVDVAG